MAIRASRKTAVDPFLSGSGSSARDRSFPPTTLPGTSSRRSLVKERSTVSSSTQRATSKSSPASLTRPRPVFDPHRFSFLSPLLFLLLPLVLCPIRTPPLHPPSAWAPARDLTHLEKKQIDSYISDQGKKKGELLEGYQTAADPEAWEAHQEELTQAKLDAEEGVDELEEEDEGEDEKATTGSKRKAGGEKRASTKKAKTDKAAKVRS
jgi:IS5 family transposase